MDSTIEQSYNVNTLTSTREKPTVKKMVNINDQTEEKQNEFVEFKISKFGKGNKPCTSIVCGPTGSGKTRFTMNFLNKAKDKYDIIYAFLGSRGSYEEYANYIDPRYIFHADQDLLPIPEKKFEHILIKNDSKYHPIVNWINFTTHEIIHMNQMAMKKNPAKYEKNPKYKSLILFDDIHAALNNFNLRHDIFKTLFRYHRCNNMDIIVTAQTLRDLQQDIISCVTRIIPFNPTHFTNEMDHLSRITKIPKETLKEMISSLNSKGNTLIIKV